MTLFADYSLYVFTPSLHGFANGMQPHLPWYCFIPDLIIIQPTHNFENVKIPSFAG